MARNSSRFFLADIVAIVAISGLAFGILRSSGSRASVAVFAFLILVVVTAWTLFRARRNAPIRDECGKRFITQQKKPPPPPNCPQCGYPQRSSARRRRVLAILFWSVLALIVLNVVVTTRVRLDAGSPLSRSLILFFFVALPIAMIVLGGLGFALAVALVLNGFARSKPVACEKCGAILPKGGTTASVVCHQCRQQLLPRPQAKVEGSRAIVAMFAMLAIVGILAGLTLRESAGSSLGVSYWIVLPLSVMATIVVFFAFIYATKVLRSNCLDRLVENWRDWVREQGTGPYTLPPPSIEAALVDRVIPLVEDRQAKSGDRILAIRNMGCHGYALGADALIDLLKSDESIPQQELRSAMESMSGDVYVDDVFKWTEWWNTLPAEIRVRRHLTHSVELIT